MGHIKLNTLKLSSNYDQIHQNFAQVFRAVGHILAMSPSLFKYYINPKTGKKLGLNNVIRKTGKKSEIITPKVVAFVQDHFKCKTLSGAPLEDEGSHNAHWEKRFFGSEIMSAGETTNSVISKLTISLLEDSGWYVFRRGTVVNNKVIDYEPFYWLKGEGCNVYNEKCPVTSSTCSKLGSNGCSYDGTYQGTCSTSVFGNGCKYFVPSTPWVKSDCRVLTANGHKKVAGGMSKLEEYRKRYFNVNGPGSRCFNGSIKDSVSGFTKTENFCFKPRCVKKTQNSYELQIKFGLKWLTCKKNNEKLKVTGEKSGTITCPSNVSSFCERYSGGCKNDCFGKGRCMANRKCQCYSGFSGHLCDDRTILHIKSDGKKDIQSITMSDVDSKDPKCCRNGGVYNKFMGLCLCNVGYTGTSCQHKDTLTLSYYTAPKNSVSAVTSCDK